MASKCLLSPIGMVYYVIRAVNVQGNGLMRKLISLSRARVVRTRIQWCTWTFIKEHPCLTLTADTDIHNISYYQGIVAMTLIQCTESIHKLLKIKLIKLGF